MIIASIGNFMQEIGMIRIEESVPLEILYYLIPVFAMVIIFVAVVLMVIVAIFCWKAHQKYCKYDQLILELEKLESSVARECKLGFAELQTDLDELTEDVVGCRLPYKDLQSYLLTTLFPGAKTHPVLQNLEVSGEFFISLSPSPLLPSLSLSLPPSLSPSLSMEILSWNMLY